MSAAELLRRAAEKLRHAVRPDCVFVAPWTVGSSEAWARFNRTVQDPEGTVAVADSVEAEYIALMHPPVALALAEWLELIAECAAEGFGITPERAEAVARAILREDQ